MIEVYYAHSGGHEWLLDGRAAAAALTEEEMDRYRAYRTDLKRKEFLLGRLLMKSLLGRKYGMSPHDVKLNQTAYGKPAFPGEWQFNLTHANGVVACALVRHRRVGIDLEYMEASNLNLVGHVCSQEERNYVQANAGSELHAFYEIWTKKEALIKAAGTGFAMDPKEIRIALGAQRGERDGWLFMEPCQLLPAYQLAIAVELLDAEREPVRMTIKAWDVISPSEWTRENGRSPCDADPTFTQPSG
ncbi:4'-phosphopantetheinyl transferase family protein [Paenibacillus methanolicus]|uniref:4'-phosphopantetheinyl transferase n=1 Tax=Paenibacillus methanolicus TaxID=582686 RepID=A0A5S5C1R1_9BACL|nr:4'-phosphopantetheinyl transferase superfamily protein [Paenibacillus methanolicus]TYP72402.1 4'-phosphopantetheinyl transferase [Paenibacillus methanolicus]